MYVIADDMNLYEAFLAFDQHMPLAMAGYKVDYASTPKKARDLLLEACRKYRSTDNSGYYSVIFIYRYRSMHIYVDL